MGALQMGALQMGALQSSAAMRQWHSSAQAPFIEGFVAEGDEPLMSAALRPGRATSR